MRRDVFWRFLFAGAIAVLMLGILLSRHVTPPLWVLIAYPAIGAMLAHVVSRTSTNRKQIAMLETASIAAACVVFAATIVHACASALFLDAVRAKTAAADQSTVIVFFVLLTLASLMSWWALERRIRKLRSEDLGAETDDEGAPARS